MAKQLQLRGGTTAEHAVFVGAPRELTIDTEKNEPVVHDGITPGGVNIATVSRVEDGLATKIDALDAYTRAEIDAKDSVKVNIADIQDVLTAVDTDKPLSANQGKILKDYIDAINDVLSSDDVSLDELQEIVDFIKLNRADLDALSISSIAGLQDALDEKIDALDAYTRAEIDAKDDTKLDKVGGTITGNLQVDGTVNGRDFDADGVKLDTVEENAKDDQTGAEIKALYEAEADTNVLTDADKAKYDGYEAEIDSKAEQIEVDAELVTKADKVDTYTKTEVDVKDAAVAAGAVNKTAETGSAVLPSGDTSQRDVSAVEGYLRYNSETNEFEGYKNGQWGAIGGGQMLDINGLTAKVIAIDTDNMILQETGGILKKLSVLNLKTTLKTYFDGIYSMFGIGQTWQNVKASRSAGVTYTNPTGKPIKVAVRGNAVSAAQTLSCVIDGLTIFNSNGVGYNGQTVAAEWFVPTNATYKVQSSSTFTLISWYELR